MRKALVFFFSLFLSSQAIQAFAEPATQNKAIIPYKVNLDAAHALVKTGIGLDYKEGFIDLQKMPDKNGFFIMRGAGKESQSGEFIDNTGKHFPVFEWYYVNAWTGDVWNNCQRLSNPALHEPLAKIKALFQGDELKNYDRLRMIPAYQMHVAEEPEVTRCIGPAHADYSAMGIAARESVPYKVNINMVYALVESVLGLHTKNSGLDSHEVPDENGFFIMDRYGNHKGLEGRYAVNAWTGDVWDVFSCKRLSAPALREEQVKIKQQFHGAETKKYAHLHAMRARDVTLEPCGSPDSIFPAMHSR